MYSKCNCIKYYPIPATDADNFLSSVRRHYVSCGGFHDEINSPVETFFHDDNRQGSSLPFRTKPPTSCTVSRRFFCDQYTAMMVMVIVMMMRKDEDEDS